MLDYGENILNHGAVDEIVERQLAKGDKKKGKGDPVMKRCDKCETMVYASARQCPECGYMFPIDTLPKIQQKAARLAVLSHERESQKETLKVDKVFYSIHQKAGKPDSLKVTYNCGMRMVSEWVCFDHDGFAKRKARSWWIDRIVAGAVTSQPTTKEAHDYILSCGIKEPKAIDVSASGKYHQVTGYHDLEFPEDAIPF